MRNGRRLVIPRSPDSAAAPVDQFHPRSALHRPITVARAWHRGDTLGVRFSVADRYVVCRNTGLHSAVCRDSCVEFFVQPRGAGGYFNFEVNCGGALLVYYIEDPTRTESGFRKFRPLEVQDAAEVRVVAALPPVLEREVAEPLGWTIRLEVPVPVLERYAGPLGDLSGQTWRGNFYKCADQSSQPHWASWNPIGETLDFHQPERFAELSFE